MKKKKKSNNEKKGNKKMILRARMALKNEFYLEASWIISAILEKRLNFLLDKVEHQKPLTGHTFDQNIKRLKFLQLTSNHALLASHFTVEIIDELRTWKNQRNEIMKDMLVRHITKDRMERLSKEGIRILKGWNERIKSFKSDFKNQD